MCTQVFLRPLQSMITSYHEASIDRRYGPAGFPQVNTCPPEVKTWLLALTSRAGNSVVEGSYLRDLPPSPPPSVRGDAAA